MITNLLPNFLALTVLAFFVLVVTKLAKPKLALSRHQVKEVVGQALALQITEETLPFVLDEITLATQNKDFSRAEDLCNQLIGVIPESIFCSFLLYKSQQYQSNFSKAEIALRKVIELQLAEENVKKSVPRQYIRSTKSIAEILKESPVIKQRESEVPTLFENLFELGRILQQQNKNDLSPTDWLDSSISVFRKCLELDAHYAPAHFTVGTILQEHDCPVEEYLPYFEAAFRYDQSMLEVGIMLGNTFVLLKDYAKATLMFNKVLSHDPKNSLAHQGLGVVYLQQKQLVRAKAAFEKAIETGMEDVGLFTRIASVYNQLEEYSDAEAFYRKAIALEPTASRYFQLGQVCLLLKKKTAALESFAKAVELEDDRAQYIEAYAELLQELGEELKAKPFWEKLLKVDAANKKAVQALARLV
ncbi:MAG: tetratricopeptide repeat protein [bacterium]